MSSPATDSVLFECTARTSRDAGTLGNVIIVEQAASVVWAASSCIYTVSAFQCNRRGLKENCGSGCCKVLMVHGISVNILELLTELTKFDPLITLDHIQWCMLRLAWVDNIWHATWQWIICWPNIIARQRITSKTRFRATEWGSENGKHGFFKPLGRTDLGFDWGFHTLQVLQPCDPSPYPSPQNPTTTNQKIIKSEVV